MKTLCISKKFKLEDLGRRSVEADFSAGRISSDGGGLLLREIDRRLRLTERLSECFVDFRKPELIEHSVQQMLSQRVYGLALGYEDLNDHDALSRDPLLATLVDKPDPTGEWRRHRKDRGLPLASASTLGRIERSKESANKQTRYEKVVCDFDRLAELFTELFVEATPSTPQVLVLDLGPQQHRDPRAARATVLPTATIASTATFPCIYSAVSTHWPRYSDLRTWMVLLARWSC